ncbi:outer membrane protein [Bartonella sp. DGB1]|uniref:outer membrane protein n=1 Tax=Bartonella sp. DGB1 TaxID=3239807 RepID=UPI00352616D5
MKLKYMIATSVVALLSVSGVNAADVTSKKAIAAPTVVAMKSSNNVVNDFSGAYVGLQAGFSFNQYTLRKAEKKADEAEKTDFFSTSSNSVPLGIVAGYNLQKDDFVAGIDFAASYHFGISKADKIDDAVTDKFADLRRYNYMGDASLRARVGYAVAGFMPYVATGVSTNVTYYNLEKDAKVDDVEIKTAEVKGTNLGVSLSVGAGVEYAISKNISVRAEYGYNHLVYSKHFASNTVAETAKTESDLVGYSGQASHAGRLAVTYRF